MQERKQKAVLKLWAITHVSTFMLFFFFCSHLWIGRLVFKSWDLSIKITSLLIFSSLRIKCLCFKISWKPYRQEPRNNCSCCNINKTDYIIRFTIKSQKLAVCTRVKHSPTPEQAQVGRGGCWTLATVRAAPEPRVTCRGQWPMGQHPCARDPHPLPWVARVAHAHLALCRMPAVLAEPRVSQPWVPLGPCGSTPDFLAGRGKRCCSSAPEIMWRSGWLSTVQWLHDKSGCLCHVLKCPGCIACCYFLKNVWDRGK